MSDPIRKKRSRLVEYGFIVVLLGGVVSAAMFQEQISYFFGMRMWDKGAPGSAVTQFLEAGKKGDKSAADALLGTKEFQPLLKDGKWIGYFMVTQAGKLQFIISEIAPKDGAKVKDTEFIYAGEGSALVTVPDSKGAEVKYMVRMKENGWKIIEIRGGRPG